MVGISELSNSLSVMWHFCCCGSYAYFSNFDSTSGNFLYFWISRAVILVLAFSQLCLIFFPKKAHMMCWHLQTVKHPHSCLIILLSGTGESIGGAKVKGKKRWEIFPSDDCLGRQPSFSYSSTQVLIDEHYIVWSRILCWPIWVSHPASVLSQLPMHPRPTHWGSRWEKENLEVVLFSNTQNISVLSAVLVTNPKHSAIGAV